jgi:hypothetical protein
VFGTLATIATLGFMWFLLARGPRFARGTIQMASTSPFTTGSAYATRLRRVERAEGPACYGLARFVQSLSGDGSADLFVVNSDETAWVGSYQPTDQFWT